MDDLSTHRSPLAPHHSLGPPNPRASTLCSTTRAARCGCAPSIDRGGGGSSNPRSTRLRRSRCGSGEGGIDLPSVPEGVQRSPLAPHHSLGPPNPRASTLCSTTRAARCGCAPSIDRGGGGSSNPRSTRLRRSRCGSGEGGIDLPSVPEGVLDPVREDAFRMRQLEWQRARA
ncbi:hypothetical protein SORBI_3004G136500 [Sorghum bicolor]|uniref:Uncharacterized protein n=1 Tax=Sorghum bicolor TaxID=4558 RepID=A0A194YPL4_SORBI|nr:hypothetical protein SORBI_3004G136500 [Sorghum bicolor]